MASLMGSIKDRTSKEFLKMQSFQLEKTWVCLSWPWQAGDGLYSTLLERHKWCRSWHAHHYPTILQFFGCLLLGIIMCPSRLQINRFITLLGRLRLSGDHGLSHRMPEFFRIQLQTNFCPLAFWLLWEHNCLMKHWIQHWKWPFIATECIFFWSRNIGSNTFVLANVCRWNKSLKSKVHVIGHDMYLIWAEFETFEPTFTVCF